MPWTPPFWAILLGLVIVALPASALAGLAAIWLYDQFTRKPPPEKPFDTL